MNGTIERFNIFLKYKFLLTELVSKDIKLKYRRSFLGYLWCILNPLLQMLIMVVVFSNVFRFDIPNYPVYLITGQTIFNYVSEATNQSMWSILGNASLMKKVYIPKYIFTVSKVTSSMVNMIFSLAAMAVVLVVCKIKFSWAMIFIPVVILQTYLFTMGLSMILATLTVFFRDIQYIYTAFLSAWLYLTPMFYPIQMLPPDLANAIKTYNPLYNYITQFRTICLEGMVPNFKDVAQGFVVSMAFLLLGMVIFYKKQDKFILYV